MDLPLILLAAILGLWFLSIRGKFRNASPQQLTQVMRRTFFFTLLALVVATATTVYRRDWDSIEIIAFGVFLVTYLAYKSFFSDDSWSERQSFAHDPGRCGRCHRELGNDEIVTCPSCGWHIPDVTPVRESAEWAFWWKSWRISDSIDWRYHLRQSVYAIVLSVGFGVVCTSIVGLSWPALIPLAMIAHFMIEVIRLIQYGRAHRSNP